ncbi:MAG TPA: sigma-70 family RNA polymerase sigma factor, partial [Pseudosphingobacterium sp.]|nr:sigma-70 family RNA polymerase sigma factor [Pseudosphingobacterium sp.]
MTEEKQSRILTSIKSYGKELLGFIRKRVNNEADAEDILQDVWYQLSAVVNSQPVEQIGAWLYRVAKNKIIDKHRKKKELAWNNNLIDEDDNVKIEDER